MAKPLSVAGFIIKIDPAPSRYPWTDADYDAALEQMSGLEEGLRVVVHQWMASAKTRNVIVTVSPEEPTP